MIGNNQLSNLSLKNKDKESPDLEFNLKGSYLLITTDRTNNTDPNREIRLWNQFYGTSTCFIGYCMELVCVENRGLSCRDLELAQPQAVY